MNRVVRRLAWRDLKKHKGMAFAAILLIALPVALIISLGTVWSSTSWYSFGGNEQARIDGIEDTSIRQTPDRTAQWFTGEDAVNRDVPAIETIDKIVAPNTVTLSIDDDQWLLLKKSDDTFPISGSTVATGSAQDLLEGALPGDGEIALSRPAAVALGASVGDTVYINTEECPANGECVSHLSPVKVTGITTGVWIYGEEMKSLDEMTFAELARAGWVTGHITGDAPVTWEQLKELNAYGVSVYSKHLIDNPPSQAEVEAYMGGTYAPSGADALSLVATASLIILGVMEVLLIITPSFTIAAKRNERNLAQVAAVGGTPGHLRGVMLVQGLILGIIGGIVGVVGGLALLGCLSMLSGETATPKWWLPLFASAVAVGLGLLAALWPARKAGRTDVVAVLNRKEAGRVPSRRTAIIPPIIALACAAAVFYWRGTSTLSIILVLVGLIALALSAPLFVRVGAWLVGRINFPFRLGGRDAVRNMHRTGPAVAAITIVIAVATIAGQYAATAVSASFRGDEVLGGEGDGLMTLTNSHTGGDPRASLDLAIDEFGQMHPVESVTYLDVLDQWSDEQARISIPEEDQCIEWSASDIRCTWNQGQMSSMVGTYLNIDGLVVAPDQLKILTMIPESQRELSYKILSEGGVLTSNPYAVHDGHATIDVLSFNTVDGLDETLRNVELPAAATLPAGTQAPGVVYSPGAAKSLGLPVVTTAAIITTDSPLTIWDTRDLNYWQSHDSIATLSQINAPDYELTFVSLTTLGICLLIVLATSVLVVILGSRAARSDLDTIDAVGAKPRLRRKFSAAVAFITTAAASLPGWVTGVFGAYLLFGGLDWSSAFMTLAIPAFIIGVVTLIAYLFPPKTLGLTRRMD